MTTQLRADAILRKIVELANEGKNVTFEADFGGNSLTIYVDGAHTHVGYEDAPFDLLVENLYNTLHGGPGLSWFDPEQKRPDPANSTPLVQPES